jgi:hypothetical protein
MQRFRSSHELFKLLERAALHVHSLFLYNSQFVLNLTQLAATLRAAKTDPGCRVPLRVLSLTNTWLNCPNWEIYGELQSLARDLAAAPSPHSAKPEPLRVLMSSSPGWHVTAGLDASTAFRLNDAEWHDGWPAGGWSMFQLGDAAWHGAPISHCSKCSRRIDITRIQCWTWGCHHLFCAACRPHQSAICANWRCDIRTDCPMCSQEYRRTSGKRPGWQCPVCERGRQGGSLFCSDCYESFERGRDAPRAVSPMPTSKVGSVSVGAC